jgi:hypothetical protein
MTMFANLALTSWKHKADKLSEDKSDLFDGYGYKHE